MSKLNLKTEVFLNIKIDTAIPLLIVMLILHYYPRQTVIVPQKSDNTLSTQRSQCKKLCLSCNTAIVPQKSVCTLKVPNSMWKLRTTRIGFSAITFRICLFTLKICTSFHKNCFGEWVWFSGDTGIMLISRMGGDGATPEIAWDCTALHRLLYSASGL